MNELEERLDEVTHDLEMAIMAYAGVYLDFTDSPKWNAREIYHKAYIFIESFCEEEKPKVVSGLSVSNTEDSPDYLACINSYGYYHEDYVIEMGIDLEQLGEYMYPNIKPIETENGTWYLQSAVDRFKNR